MKWGAIKSMHTIASRLILISIVDINEIPMEILVSEIQVVIIVNDLKVMVDTKSELW